MRELEQNKEDQDYEHLLEKEAIILRAKTQKEQAKDALTDAEEKQDRLNALVLAAEQSTKALERKLRLEKLAADKAFERCETLAAAKETININLEEKVAEMERHKARNEEADNELRKLCTQVKQLEKELRRKGDAMEGLTEAARLKEITLQKKVSQGEVRVEKYKSQATELKRQIQKLGQEVNDLRKINTSLVKEVVEQNAKAKVAAEQWELRLKIQNTKDIKSERERDDLLAELVELKAEKTEFINIRQGSGKGNPVNDKFVRHVRALLATGGSAPATLKQLALNAQFFLNDEDFNQFNRDMPSLRWFQYQREGLGLECYLYTLTRIAKCDRVLQWGFDETSLDGVATMNQWVRIKEGNDLHIVTLECAGLLVGSTASKVAEHVRLFWQHGQEAIAMVREELGELADELVPLVNGGISLSKLGGVMHDTCNCANAIARRVRVLRNESGKDLYGEEEWKRMAKEEHAWCDYFCGNHSRNLQFDAFGRLYEAYIKRHLGHGLEAARVKSGGRVRVEASGEALLRTICKLTHIGPKQYAKGSTLSVHCASFPFPIV